MRSSGRWTASGSSAAAVAIAAVRHGDHTGLIDEPGPLTFAELDARSDALACGCAPRRGRGDASGSSAATTAASSTSPSPRRKLGARLLYLNTDFAGPQLRDVCAREGVTLLVHDEEYDELMARIEARQGTLLGWTDGPAGEDTLEALIAEYAGQRAAAPSQPAHVVLLTSGTTGTPEGRPAPRRATRCTRSGRCSRRSRSAATRVELRRGADVPRPGLHPDDRSP